MPFGGGEHDWAALELAGWLASATGSPLRLVGTKADPQRGRRDASRLLADASLAVQRVVGVETEPVLAEPTEEGLLRAVAAAGIVVAGISEQWQRTASAPAGARSSAPPCRRRSWCTVACAPAALRPARAAPVSRGRSPSRAADALLHPGLGGEEVVGAAVLVVADAGGDELDDAEIEDRDPEGTIDGLAIEARPELCRARRLAVPK